MALTTCLQTAVQVKPMALCRAPQPRRAREPQTPRYVSEFIRASA
jgi:hypothetical protein